MIKVNQYSNKNKVLVDINISEAGTNKISCAKGSLWIHGNEYKLSKEPNIDMSGSITRLYIEKTDTGADYMLDYTGEAEPVSFGDGIGAVLIAWIENNNLYVLNHVEV